MTNREVYNLLRTANFRPFRIVMNNGKMFDVRHPETAIVESSGALYLFHARTDDDADVAGLNNIVAIHNISDIEFLPAGQVA